MTLPKSSGGSWRTWPLRKRILALLGLVALGSVGAFGYLYFEGRSGVGQIASAIVIMAAAITMVHLRFEWLYGAWGFDHSSRRRKSDSNRRPQN